MTAVLVIHIATQLGIDIPRDLSVIAVGYSQLAAVLHPTPVMIEPDFGSMMQAGVGILRALKAKRPVAEPVQRFAPRLTEGKTVAFAPQSK